MIIQQIQNRNLTRNRKREGVIIAKQKKYKYGEYDIGLTDHGPGRERER